MTTAPTPDLRALSNAVKAWACCNEAWPHAEHFDVAVVGGITDGEQYPVAQIDADTYGTDGESLKLAQFYAAANPGAVLALLDRIDALQAENEHLLAQIHKLEMDALDLAIENSILKRQDELAARKPLPLSYRAGAMTSSRGGGATVTMHFNDTAEAEAWFVAITDQHDAGLVDKSPNLHEPLVDKTANLQDRPAPLSDEQIDDLHGEANRGFDIGRDEYFKAFRDAERAHGIKET